MALVFEAKAVANKLTLQGLNGFDDVVRARVGDVLPSLFRGSSINKQLTLTTVAGVGAEDGIGSHGFESNVTEASLPHAQNCTGSGGSRQQAPVIS